MYTIEIDYETGSSFGSERRIEEVGWEWKDLNKAKESLRRIKEHHKACRTRKYDHRDTGPKERWSTKKEGWEYSVIIEDDDGNPAKIAAFWEGYFETLYSAEILIAEDPDIKFKV